MRAHSATIAAAGAETRGSCFAANRLAVPAPGKRRLQGHLPSTPRQLDTEGGRDGVSESSGPKLGFADAYSSAAIVSDAAKCQTASESTSDPRRPRSRGLRVARQDAVVTEALQLMRAEYSRDFVALASEALETMRGGEVGGPLVSW